jgi:DNA helicase II / ATP-dependent DNA helicase PcrA
MNIEELNPKQREAVEHTDGPILILAGAGTGKTKVLTSKIAYLVDKNYAYPSQVLAVTFTNKAAQEMKHRVSAMVNPEGLWLGTFHSIASRILRIHCAMLGLSENFIIIGIDDQIRLIKTIIKEQNIDDKKFPAKVVLDIIQRWKDMSISEDAVSDSDIKTPLHQITKRIYKIYQSRLRVLEAVDFGDLLLLNIKLFTDNPELLSLYQEKFHYILVDEYQDTNIAQYIWLRMLAQYRKNICCVGDEDQSIYGWRGAEIGNILRFEKDFPGAQVIKLEQNYRSTDNILKAASNLIANNKNRIGKTLWTDIGSGEKIKIICSIEERDESNQVYRIIQELYQSGTSYKNMAILVRAGFQTRNFEECFIANGLPYKIIGGLRFYERLEIRDIISYIRVSVNNDDSLAFERIINTPKRSIGVTTINKIYEYANLNEISLLKASQNMINEDLFSKKTAESISSLINLIQKWHEEFKEQDHINVIKNILNESGYLDMWKNENTIEAKGRIENINELITGLADFSSIQEFLEHVSLIADNDQIDQDNMVNLMTIHSAKGLEFNVVFLPGFEEGLFPHQRSIEESGNAGLEEERRLAYVAITRAKKHLYISYALSRRVYGQWQQSIASRFIDELGHEAAHKTSPHMPENQYNYKNRQPSKVNNINSNIGKKVHHHKFGQGKIINQAGDFLDIVFENNGIKKIMKEFVEIQ